MTYFTDCFYYISLNKSLLLFPLGHILVFNEEIHHKNKSADKGKINNHNNNSKKKRKLKQNI